MLGCDFKTGGESGIRTRSQTANKGLNRARSANLVLVSACKTGELILSDLHPVFQMRRLEPAASAVTVLRGKKHRATPTERERRRKAASIHV
jgi:hypothetical protein